MVASFPHEGYVFLAVSRGVLEAGGIVEEEILSGFDLRHAFGQPVEQRLSFGSDWAVMQGFVGHGFSEDLGVLKFGKSNFEFGEELLELGHDHEVDALADVVAANGLGQTVEGADVVFALGVEHLHNGLAVFGEGFDDLGLAPRVARHLILLEEHLVL